MSIVALKNKTKAKKNISGKINPNESLSGFSLNGGYRNQGYVGQTSLSRSVTRTPFKGEFPMGNGGYYGEYKDPVYNSGGCCGNKHRFIKPSVINNRGMIYKKNKWLQGGGLRHHSNPAQNPTKPINSYSEHTQGLYILSKSATNATTISKNNTKAVNSNCNKCNYTKDLLPIDYSRYMLFLNRPSVKSCSNVDPSGNKCPAGSCATCENHFKSTTGL